MDQERMGWSEVVRLGRERFSMTQRQLASAAGVSLKTVSNIETEGVAPQRGTLQKVLRALGLPFNQREAEVEVRQPIELMIEDLEEDHVPSVVRVVSAQVVRRSTGRYGIELRTEADARILLGRAYRTPEEAVAVAADLGYEVGGPGETLTPPPD